MRIQKAAIVALLSLGAIAEITGARAQPNPAYVQEMNRDQQGAGDHPLTGRYGGSKLLTQTIKAFDEITFPAGPAQGQPWDNSKKFTQTVSAQGKVTRSLYVAPTGRSSLEIFVNLRDALVQKGFSAAFECAGDACGPSFPVLKYAWDNKAAHVLPERVDPRRKALVEAMFDRNKDPRYAFMKKSAAEGDTYVALYVALNEGGSFGDISASLTGWPGVLLEVCEPRAMEQRIETIAAAQIGSTLAAQGRVAFYGIFFDFDKADLKPQSDPQLQEMARFLAASPGVRAYVIGHTDNKGQLAYNVGLSERRANAFVAALTSRFGVDKARLVARGLGPLAPIATNRTEDGQAKNRRVELVEQ